MLYTSTYDVLCRWWITDRLGEMRVRGRIACANIKHSSRACEWFFCLLFWALFLLFLFVLCYGHWMSNAFFHSINLSLRLICASALFFQANLICEFGNWVSILHCEFLIGSEITPICMLFAMICATGKASSTFWLRLNERKITNTRWSIGVLFRIYNVKTVNAPAKI